ncbi:MAG: hypothetical protein U0264_15690 [Candidatus Kapaibacterium sp.]
MPKKTESEKPERTPRTPERAEVLNVAQVAEIINADPEVVRQLMKDGAIRSFWFGDRMKASRKEVMAFIDECVEGTIKHQLIRPIKPFIPPTRHRKST